MNDAKGTSVLVQVIVFHDAPESKQTSKGLYTLSTNISNASIGSGRLNRYP